MEERGLAEIMVAHLLESSGRWFDSNRLIVNRDKTRRLRCTLNRTSSSNDSFVKLVGFILDPKLTWDDPTPQMCKRPLVSFGAVSLEETGGKGVLGDKLSWNEFSMPTSGTESISGDARVLLWQKKGIRLIFGAKRRDLCRTLFTRLKLMQLVCPLQPGVREKSTSVAFSQGTKFIRSSCTYFELQLVYA